MLLHRRKAQLIQLAFEKDLTHKSLRVSGRMLSTGREDSADSTQSKLPCVRVSNGNAYPSLFTAFTPNMLYCPVFYGYIFIALLLCIALNDEE